MTFKIFSVLLLGLLIFPTTSFAATPSISTSETVANVTAGTDDQTGATTATQANVSEVKASRTLTVGVLPGNAETITIGTCVVTFTTVAGATTDELNCTDNAASIDRNTGVGDTPRSAADIAGIMRTLTNVSDTGHGALTITGSGAEAIFTTTGAETSATAITFTDGTTGDITSTASTTGVIAAAQVNTITIAGTVDTGDVFTATLPTVGAVTYTVTSSDTTTANIATGLNAAIQASSGYASQAFTSAASTNTVVLTAKVAGTGFTQTSSATNRAAVAQVVVFTPSNVTGGYDYVITINGTKYTSTQTGSPTAKTIVEALQPLVNANSAVSCTEDDTAITCTAGSAGTAFTYSTAVNQRGSSDLGTSASSRVRNLVNNGNCTLALDVMRQYPGPTSNQQQYYQQKCGVASITQQTIAELQAQINALMAQLAAFQGGSTAPSSAVFTRGLSKGMFGEDVRLLQQFMNKSPETQVVATGDGSPGNETTYFGTLTEVAVQKFQIKHGIAAENDPGYGVVGPKTRAKLLEVFGN